MSIMPRHCGHCQEQDALRRAAEAEAELAKAERDHFKAALESADLFVKGWKEQAETAEAKLGRYKAALRFLYRMAKERAKWNDLDTALRAHDIDPESL